MNIIAHILDNPYITSKELSVLVGISAESIRENISKLKVKGFLERVGENKGGYWKVKY